MPTPPRFDVPGGVTTIGEPTLVTHNGRRSTSIQVICPVCQSIRWAILSHLRRLSSREGYTGMCQSCLYANASETKPRFDMTGIPSHPAISGEPTLIQVGDTRKVCLKVTCARCNKETWWQLTILRRYQSNFHGMCIECWRDGGAKRKLRHKRNPTGRRLGANGYVQLGKNAIVEEDLGWFRIMCGKGGFVLEHRWVMAKHLGRPLTSAECVDHMDGNKQNNDVANLRIYVRGKQQPGSCPGHGTYYHEWQMAERRAHELEERIKELESQR